MVLVETMYDLRAGGGTRKLVLVETVTCELVAGGWGLVETVTCELAAGGWVLVETVS